jgi:hypothetical protein
MAKCAKKRTEDDSAQQTGARDGQIQTDERRFR